MSEKVDGNSGSGLEVSGAELERMRDREFALCASDFWYFAQFLETDDEERQIRRPFPLDFNYLKDIITRVGVADRIVLLKPRRMIVSLTMVSKQLHNAKFAGTGVPGSLEVYYGGYSATDETLALYQLFRISQLHSRLPLWLQNRNPLVVDNALMKIFEKGGKIQGFPLRRQGPQGHGFSDFIFDEAAWQEAAATTYRGLAPTIGKGKIIIISTPNGDEGTGEFFHNLWHGKGDRYQNYDRIEIDWWDNPEHDQDWFDRMSADLQPWEVAQMYEKSFIVVEGDPVFPEASRTYHVADTQFLAGQPIYIKWDFGYDYPAALITQRNTRDQWLYHREFCGDHIDFGIFCKLVLDQANALYERKKCPEIHFIDPAGLQRYSQKGQSGANCDAHEIKIRWDRQKIDGTDVQIRPGVVHVGTREHESPRLKEVRKLFLLRGDDRYGVIINPECKTLIDGLTGGYVRDKYGKPIKNRFSHPIDAMQYGVTAYNRMTDPELDKKKRRGKKPSRIGMRTGL